MPELGDTVHVWPSPGRRAQDGARALDSGGRFLTPAGRDVVWTEFHGEQYLAGDLTLHDPTPSKPDAAGVKTGG